MGSGHLRNLNLRPCRSEADALVHSATDLTFGH